MKSPNSNSAMKRALAVAPVVPDGGSAPSPDEDQDRSGFWLVFAGVAASVGVLGGLLGALDVLHLTDAWPIAFGACVSILLLPLVLRGVVSIKSDAAAAAGGKGGATSVFLRR